MSKTEREKMLEKRIEDLRCRTEKLLDTFQIHLFVVLIIILSPTRLLRKIRTTVHTVQYHIRLGNSGNLELCVQMQMRSPI